MLYYYQQRMEGYVTLLAGGGEMMARLGPRGRMSLTAITVVALLFLNLNGALAAGGDLVLVGDRVWHDESGQGDQNENCVGPICVPEPGLNGVAVYLYKDNGDWVFDRHTDTFLDWTTTRVGASQDPDGWLDGIYEFEVGPGAYWVWVDESTLPSGQWTLTTGNNPREVHYTGGDDFSADFGYEPLAFPVQPTIIYLPLVFSFHWTR